MPLCDLIYLNNTSSVSRCQSPSNSFFPRDRLEFSQITTDSQDFFRKPRLSGLGGGWLGGWDNMFARFPLHRSPNITMVRSCWVSRATRCWKYAQVKLTIIYPIVGGRQHNQCYHHLKWFSWVARSSNYLQVYQVTKSTEPKPLHIKLYHRLRSKFGTTLQIFPESIVGNAFHVWPVGHTGFAKDAPLHDEKEDWLPSFEAPGNDVQIPQKEMFWDMGF